jgi:pilus assembly protein CpaC
MKNIKLISILFGLSLSLPSWAADAQLILGVQQQKPLEVPSELERVAVADPNVADVLVLKRTSRQKGSVLVIGKKPGTTTVSVWPRNGEPTVWNVQVQSALQGQPAGTERLQVHGSTAVISGHSPSLLDHAATTATAVAAVGKDKIVDTATVGPGGVVQIDVKIVEFSKSVLKEAGFDFLFRRTNGNFSFGIANNLSSSLGTQTPASAAFQLVTGLNHNNSNLATSLQLIEMNGLARVLAQPSLTALSGQSASFLAGGELPIPQAGGLGTITIVYKPFGIGLTVTPTVLSSDRIALKVAPEASDIDYTNALVANNISIPAITTRRAETTLELGNGESFVIGGLVSRNTRSNLSKVPFLGDLPIIGTFFRNMHYTQDEKELVIIVTPHLVNAIAKGTNLALPGSDKEKRDIPTNAWGAYLLGTAASDDVPGFSK